MRGILKKSEQVLAASLDSEANFSTEVPGKWILAGEHSVLRGGEAIVFPLPSQYLKLAYKKSEQDLEIQLDGDGSQDLEMIIWSVLENALKKLNIKRQQLRGILHFTSHIRFGAGMGASATLCVALTQLFQHLGFINEEAMYEFARNLENLFHGESSGVDVAVALWKKPMIFSRTEGFKTFDLAFKPRLYLSYTGVRGVTKDCVEKVKQILLTQPERGKMLDQNMIQTVQLFKKYILQVEASSLNDQKVFEICKQLMLSAHSCFEEWGLVNEEVKRHEQALKKAGALAVKLTGSGGGGYMLSLWNQAPPHLNFEMIPCFV